METPIYYASPVPWYRGRRMQRFTIRLLLVASIACAAGWAFQLILQVHYLIGQHRAMQYAMPTNQVILACATPDAPQLLRKSGYHARVPGTFDLPNNASCAMADPPANLPLSWCASDSYVFLHSRRAPGGQERLVCVVVKPQLPFEPGVGFDLIALAQIPADIRLGSRPQSCSPYGQSGALHLPLKAPLRLFAGQPDASYDSHFTIRAEIDGQPQLIDGWLMTDDSVRMELRPPADEQLPINDRHPASRAP
jgi:hypothetical protein